MDTINKRKGIPRKGMRRFASALLIAALCFMFTFPVQGGMETYAASTQAAGKISADGGACLRAHTTTSSKQLALLKDGQSVTITREVFTAKSTKASKRWYFVSAEGKQGYIRSDLMTNVTYASVPAVTTAKVNYRTGPSAGMTRKGTLGKGKAITIQSEAKMKGVSQIWYRAVINGKSYYLSAKYVKIGSSTGSAETAAPSSSGSGKTAAAASSVSAADALPAVPANPLVAGLLGTPTDGGKARYVGTFDTSNCTKLFAVTGFSKAIVPQGMAFTGSEYYVLYGMNAMQAIVTYSASGQKIKSGGFAFNIGHPNGITWDPETGLCYIFKGNQKTIYTWNPAANTYGKSKTPYSSSGVAYDKTTCEIYATSQSGVRAYSADGRFTHRKLIKRCSHGIKHYIQDCGAQDGFIFHGISGSNKQSTNFLDVYRAADGKYLGSIRIAIGEIESVVVGNDGYVQLLVNTSGKTDYVWRTPLNINDLK